MNEAQVVSFIANFVTISKNLIVYAIIGRVLLSWFSMGQMRSPGRFAGFLYDVTDPFINLARKIPHKIGMFDLAPLIALFGIDLLGQLAVVLLYKLA